MTDVTSVATQLAAAAPGIIANLPKASQFKVAALKLAGELHADMTHLFAHHSISDLIDDARKIEAYLKEGLDKIDGTA